MPSKKSQKVIEKDQSLTELEMLKIDNFNHKSVYSAQEIDIAQLKQTIEQKNIDIAKLNHKLLGHKTNDIRLKNGKMEEERLEFMNGIRERLGIKDDEPFGYNPDTGEII